MTPFLVRHIQDTILTSYLNDMSKYNSMNEIKKTRLAYDIITVQFSKKNTRFQYKLENYRDIDSSSDGIPHKHCMDTMYAVKQTSVVFVP